MAKRPKQTIILDEHICDDTCNHEIVFSKDQVEFQHFKDGTIHAIVKGVGIIAVGTNKRDLLQKIFGE